MILKSKTKNCSKLKALLILSVILFAIIGQTNCVLDLEPPKCCQGDNIYDDTICITKEIDNITTSADVLLDCKDGKYMIDPTTDEDEEFIINAKNELELITSSITYKSDIYCVTNVADNGTLRQVAMACFSEDATALAWNSFDVQGVLVFISVFFICLTLFIYLMLPDLRETQDKTTCITILCLAIFLFFLGIVKIFNLLYKYNEFCVGTAFIIYFFTLAYFSWLNTVMANVWKITVVPRWQIKERTWYLLNHLYAWTVPTIMTVLTIKNHMIKPSFGLHSCWFATFNEQWTYLYIPISVLLCLNAALFLWIALTLHMDGQDITPDRRKVLKFKCMLYLKLFLLGGLTWIFEVLSFRFGKFESNNWFWAFTDIVNCLHGVLIFLVLIVWRKRIRRELAGRKVCCCLLPNRWREIKDDECEELFDDGDAAKYDLIVK